MARPEYPEHYEQCAASHGDQILTVFVERSVLEHLPAGDHHLYFVMDVSRRYKLHLDPPLPATGKEPKL